MRTIPIDKQAHFWAGAAISATVTLLTGHPSDGMICATFFAVGKELFDRLSGKGVPELMDMLATIVGAVIPLALAQIAEGGWNGNL
jgi:hypothetical protein